MHLICPLRFPFFVPAALSTSTASAGLSHVTWSSPKVVTNKQTTYGHIICTLMRRRTQLNKTSLVSLQFTGIQSKSFWMYFNVTQSVFKWHKSEWKERRKYTEKAVSSNQKQIAVKNELILFLILMEWQYSSHRIVTSSFLCCILWEIKWVKWLLCFLVEKWSSAHSTYLSKHTQDEGMGIWGASSKVICLAFTTEPFIVLKYGISFIGTFFKKQTKKLFGK